MERGATRPGAVTAAGVLMIATVVAVDPAGLWPFGPLRWAAISTIGAVVVAIVAVGSDRLRWSATSWWWTGLLAWLLLTSLLADDRWSALIGHPQRHAGWWMWALSAALFWAGRRISGQTTMLARWATVAGLLLGVYCLWEWACGPPVATATVTRRLQGPFGSAAQLGAACCLFLPIAWMAWRDERRWRRWLVAAPAIGGCSVALVGSGSRSAWLAVTVVGIVIAAARRISWRAAAAIGGALVLAALVLIPRLGEVSERTSGSASRLDEWRVAARVIAEHPWVGVGPDNYRIAAAQGIDAAYERRYPREHVLPDRAHSAPLDVALAGGLPALALWIGLVVTVARRVWPATAGPQRGIASGVLAYGVGQLLLFPLAELDPLWWLLAGVVVGGATDSGALHRRWVGTVTALLVAASSLVAGTLDVAAGRLARTALREAAAGDLVTARDAARRATGLRPDSVAVRTAAAQAYLRLGTIADYDRAIANSDAALRWTPEDPIALDLRAVAVLARADATGAAADRSAAVQAWAQLVERDPLRARWQRQLGVAAAHAGDVELAERALQAAAGLGDAQAAALLEQLRATR